MCAWTRSRSARSAFFPWTTARRLIFTTQPGEPLPTSVWVEPYPDGQRVADGYAAPEARYEQRESVELAFIAALQHLPPRQRAVLILREVLGFSAREVAQTLETTVASVNSSLQRARAAIDERLPEQSQQATLRSLGDEHVRELVERFVDAWDRGDVDTMVAMLAEGPTFTMPPFDAWYEGPDAVEAFLPAKHGEWRLVPARANGQVALGAYRWDPRAGIASRRHLGRARPARRADRRRHRIRDTGGLRALRPAG